MDGPRWRLETERLILLAASEEHAPAVAEFLDRNREHLIPWSPPMPEEVFTTGGQHLRLSAARHAFDTGMGWRWLIVPQASPEEVIGFVSLSQVHRGVFQSAMLGYAIAAHCQGSGMMAEATLAAIQEVFSERGRLHRIQANVIPSNTRSLAMLDRLGFAREGLAKDYLFIGGAWQDHVVTALTNPDFDPRWLG